VRHQRHDRPAAGEGTVLDAQPPGPVTTLGPVSRESLAHLARDWDAQAAQIERGLDDPEAPPAGTYGGIRRARSLTLRECARQLRERLGLAE